MGTNGFQEPAVEFKDGKIVGTKRLYADGKFGSKDGKATFMETKWRGPQAPGKEAEKSKWPFLINNGRTNIVWQNAYLDQDNEFVMDRFPYPFIQINPQDMAELNVKAGDLVEVYNDNGSTQAVAYPTPTAKRKQTCMLFAYPTGVQGNVVSAGVNELIIPNYKQTWCDPQACRCAGRRAPPDVQVGGIPDRVALHCLRCLGAVPPDRAVLSLVGAGGLGLALEASLNVLAWPQVTVILIMILATVIASEWLSARVRKHII